MSLHHFFSFSKASVTNAFKSSSLFALSSIAARLDSIFSNELSMLSNFYSLARISCTELFSNTLQQFKSSHSNIKWHLVLDIAVWTIYKVFRFLKVEQASLFIAGQNSVSAFAGQISDGLDHMLHKFRFSRRTLSSYSTITHPTNLNCLLQRDNSQSFTSVLQYISAHADLDLSILRKLQRNQFLPAISYWVGQYNLLFQETKQFLLSSLQKYILHP